MQRYVLKINNSTYVNDLHWIIMEIPQIQTNTFNNALIVTDEYLDYILQGRTRKDLLLKYFPKIKIVKVKLVEVE